MICLICRQAELLEGFTTVEFQRGEMHLRLQNVPVRICPGCAEAYVEEDVAVRLLQTAQEAYEAGSAEVSAEYQAEQI